MLHVIEYIKNTPNINVYSAKICAEHFLMYQTLNTMTNKVRTYTLFHDRNHICRINQTNTRL